MRYINLRFTLLTYFTSNSATVSTVG